MARNSDLYLLPNSKSCVPFFNNLSGIFQFLILSFSIFFVLLKFLVSQERDLARCACNNTIQILKVPIFLPSSSLLGQEKLLFTYPELFCLLLCLFKEFFKFDLWILRYSWRQQCSLQPVPESHMSIMQTRGKRVRQHLYYVTFNINGRYQDVFGAASPRPELILI